VSIWRISRSSGFCSVIWTPPHSESIIARVKREGTIALKPLEAFIKSPLNDVSASGAKQSTPLVGQRTPSL
jgi:hypothetical protein